MKIPKIKKLPIILTIILLVVVIYFLFRLFGFFDFNFTSIFRHSTTLYSTLQTEFVASILNLFDISFKFNTVTNSFFINSERYFQIQFSTLYLFSIPIASGLWFLKKQAKKAIIPFLVTLFSLVLSGTVVALLLISIESLMYFKHQYFFLNTISELLVLVTVILILRTKGTSPLYSRLTELSKISQADWNTRFKILFSIPLFKIFTTTISAKVLIHSVLIPSMWITKLLGAETWIDGIYLYSERTYVMLAYGCVGMHSIMLFALFILLLRYGSWKSKTLYVLFGIAMVFIVNIIRISALFMYYHHNFGDNVMGIDSHDMFNIAVYAVIFILWIIWIERHTKRKESPRS